MLNLSGLDIRNSKEIGREKEENYADFDKKTISNKGPCLTQGPEKQPFIKIQEKEKVEKKN